MRFCFRNNANVVNTPSREVNQYIGLQGYKVFFFLFCLFITSAYIATADTRIGSESQESALVRVYEVNKRVLDFPKQDDLSTPENAYTVINHLMASGDGEALRLISVEKIRKELPETTKMEKNVKPEKIQKWLHAQIIEVLIYRDIYAAVIAQVPGFPIRYDIRSLEFDDGKWLNCGQDSSISLEAGRSHFALTCALSYTKKPVRPRIEDPESYLKTFSDFLKTEGKQPAPYLVDALKNHKVVIMGELHHRPLYWAFNSRLVTQPDFPKNVGTIYLELPCNDQALVDEFFAEKEIDPILVVEMLRDNLLQGWPDQAMLDFFTTVWMVNQGLSSDQRLRIVLVDMQRPWKDIKEKSDWAQYEVNRDQFMAENILKDIEKYPKENRNAIFIVGVQHAMLNLEYIKGYPIKSAGWYLCQDLGVQNVFSIFQHAPVMTNQGDVDGRVCLGLFDSAFAELGNKPIAFPLTRGPFGEQPFDAFPDQPSTCSLYKDGFSAYLFLGPLEYEIFSPLIAGFYTDEFVQEIERRYRLMYGKGWSERYKQEPNANNFITWMQTAWGKPYLWRNRLGPRSAWKYGDDWTRIIRMEQLRNVLKHPEILINKASNLFNSIRKIDYDKPGTSHKLDYKADDQPSVWTEWICRTFQKNPIVSDHLGEVFENDQKRPAIPYKLTLKNGKLLEGNLIFEYLIMEERWQACAGLDWHLDRK